MRIQSCEIFESSVERCPSCDAYVMDKAEAFEHEQGCDETETETLAGLFYWNCQPAIKACSPISSLTPVSKFLNEELGVFTF